MPAASSLPEGLRPTRPGPEGQTAGPPLSGVGRMPQARAGRRVRSRGAGPIPPGSLRGSGSLGSRRIAWAVLTFCPMRRVRSAYGMRRVPLASAARWVRLDLAGTPGSFGLCCRRVRSAYGMRRVRLESAAAGFAWMPRPPGSLGLSRGAGFAWICGTPAHVRAGSEAGDAPLSRRSGKARSRLRGRGRHRGERARRGLDMACSFRQPEWEGGRISLAAPRKKCKMGLRAVVRTRRRPAGHGWF